MLKPEYIERIQKDFKCRNAICYFCDVVPKTLERWLYLNHEKLGNVKILTVICSYYHVEQSEVLQPFNQK